MKQLYMKRLPENEVEYVLVPKNRRHRHHGRWLATGWSDMQPTEELREFASDVDYATIHGRLPSAYRRECRDLPQLRFWDCTYGRDTWPGHSNAGGIIRTERAFRRHLKKLADILPNGLVLMVYSKYQYLVNGKHTDMMMVGKIQGKLSVDESRKLIRRQMDKWYEAMAARDGNNDQTT